MSTTVETLSSPQLAALLVMPFELTPNGFLPSGSPSGSTLKMLERKGLAELRAGAWRRTEAGEVVVSKHETARERRELELTGEECKALAAAAQVVISMAADGGNEALTSGRDKLYKFCGVDPDA